MTLAERIERAAIRAGAPLCGRCGRHHSGAAWSPLVGWHDPSMPSTGAATAGWVGRAQTGTLTAKEMDR